MRGSSPGDRSDEEPLVVRLVMMSRGYDNREDTAIRGRVTLRTTETERTTTGTAADREGDGDVDGMARPLIFTWITGRGRWLSPWTL